MKWFLNRCRQRRRHICLLAAGVLSGSEKTDIENHLAGCADCRKYFTELKALTAALTAWENSFINLEPTADVKTRWVKAIQKADKSNPRQTLSPGSIIWNVWHELFWLSRWIWTGLAAVWILILAANLSLRSSSPAIIAKSSTTPEMISSFQQQEKILAELIGQSEPRTAGPQKAFSPRPSSGRRFEIFTA